MQRSKPLTPSTISADNCSKLRRSHCVLGFSAAKNRNSICDFGYSIWHTWNSQWLVVKKSDYRYCDELILLCTLKLIFSVIIPLVPRNIRWEMDAENGKNAQCELGCCCCGALRIGRYYILERENFQRYAPLN